MYPKRFQRLRNGIPRVYFYFCPADGILSCFLFRGMVRNGIPKACFYFCFTKGILGIFFHRMHVRNGFQRVCFFLLHCTVVHNSEHFSLPRNGSERNSENFLFRETGRIPPEQTNCSLYSDFRGIICL